MANCTRSLKAGRLSWHPLKRLDFVARRALGRLKNAAVKLANFSGVTFGPTRPFISNDDPVEQARQQIDRRTVVER